MRPLVAATQDPTIRVREHAFARTTRTPDGPATIEVRQLDTHTFEASAWGPGRDWMLRQAPALVGAQDTLEGFDATRDAVVARAHRQRPGLRMIRSGLVEDVLVFTIIAQRVTAQEAMGSWTRLVRAWGEPAPGPYNLRLPPTPDRLVASPTWALHRFGIDHGRARRIALACRRLPQMQAALGLPRDEALARLMAVPGVGIWTASLVLRIAGGDPDAVEVGDDQAKHHVAFNLAGEPRATDERMLELLTPFAGHRGRVVRLLYTAGRRPPPLGPKPRVIPIEHL